MTVNFDPLRPSSPGTRCSRRLGQADSSLLFTDDGGGEDGFFLQPSESDLMCAGSN